MCTAEHLRKGGIFSPQLSVSVPEEASPETMSLITEEGKSGCPMLSPDP
jgi:hypothetical protein